MHIPSQFPDRAACFPEYEHESFLHLEEVVLKDLKICQFS